MENNTDLCEKCGAWIHVGDYPFCPHGTGSFTNIPDDVPGGFWVENGFDTPQKFYSHSEHEAALAARGCEIRAKWAGPHDKIMSNWAAGTVDLDAAAALVQRGEQARAERRARAEEFPIEATDGEAFWYDVES